MVVSRHDVVTEVYVRESSLELGEVCVLPCLQSPDVCEAMQCVNGTVPGTIILITRLDVLQTSVVSLNHIDCYLRVIIYLVSAHVNGRHKVLHRNSTIV